MAVIPQAILAATTLLLVLLLLLLPSAASSSSTGGGTAASSFLRSSCTKTKYPDLCMASLSSYASLIQNSPSELAHAALSVSLARARRASLNLSVLSLAAAGGRVSAATRDCVENMGRSIGELKRSIAEMARPGDVRQRIDNVETWVSAALTEQQTCVDGFAGRRMDGAVKRKVKASILHVARLTSNALCFVNALYSLQHP